MVTAKLTCALVVVVMLGIQAELTSAKKNRGNRKYALGKAKCKPKCTGFWYEGFCRSDVAIVARNLRRSGDTIEVEVIEFLKGADEAEAQTRLGDDGRKYLTMRDAYKCRCSNKGVETTAESNLAADAEFMMNGFLSKGSLHAGEYRIPTLPHYQMMAASITNNPSMCKLFRKMVTGRVVKADLLRKSNVKFSHRLFSSPKTGV